MQETLKTQTLLDDRPWDRDASIHPEASLGVIPRHSAGLSEIDYAPVSHWLAVPFRSLSRAILAIRRVEINESRLATRDPWLDVYTWRRDRY